MPLSVKIIPRAPSKEEAAKEETERLEKASVDKKVAFETQRVADYTWYLAAFTVVLACVAIGQAGLFVWQLSYMKQGMEDATKAANAAESAAKAANLTAKAAVGVELPIVKLNQFVLLEITPGGQRPAIQDQPPPMRSRLALNFRNGGRTAAEAITQSVEWKVIDKLPEIPVYEHYFPYATGIFFPPDDAEPSVALQNFVIELTESQHAEIAERRAFLWVYGLVSYRDIVLGDTHEFRFCAKWQGFLAAPAAPVGFVHDSETPPEYTKRT
jgi:hypothetical protein